MEDFIGEIRMFAGNYPPRNWAYCEGQQLSIAQFSPLYSIIGSTYGGDGVKTFALPDLRVKAPLGAGAGPGLTARKLGDASKEPTPAFGTSYTLTNDNLPAHSHALSGTSNTDYAKTNDPTNAYLGSFPDDRLSGILRYNSSGITTGTLDASTIASTGKAAPTAVSVTQPYLTVGFAICLNGEFPARP